MQLKYRDYTITQLISSDGHTTGYEASDICHTASFKYLYDAARYVASRYNSNDTFISGVALGICEIWVSNTVEPR